MQEQRRSRCLYRNFNSCKPNCWPGVSCDSSLLRPLQNVSDPRIEACGALCAMPVSAWRAARDLHCTVPRFKVESDASGVYCPLSPLALADLLSRI